MVVAIVAAIDIGVGMAKGQVGMGVVMGVASVGQVVEVVRVCLSIGDSLSIRGRLCLSISVRGPLTNVVVAVVPSEGIWVAVVGGMGIGKMGVWVGMPMVVVVEVVGVSLSLGSSSCHWSSISLSSGFCRSSSNKEKSSSSL